MTELRTYLQRWIESKGLSTRQAAAALGVSKTAIEKILDGGTDTPKLSTLRLLADAFELPLARVIEMVGFDLGIQPVDPATYAHVPPAIPALLVDVAQRDPDSLAGLLSYIEFLERNRIAA